MESYQLFGRVILSYHGCFIRLIQNAISSLLCYDLPKLNSTHLKPVSTVWPLQAVQFTNGVLPLSSETGYLDSLLFSLLVIWNAVKQPISPSPQKLLDSGWELVFQITNETKMMMSLFNYRNNFPMYE